MEDQKTFYISNFLLLTGFFLSFLTSFPSLVAKVKKGFLILLRWSVDCVVPPHGVELWTY